MSLPDVPLPKTIRTEEELKSFKPMKDSKKLQGGSDSTWASDRRHRKSVGGVNFFFAGGTVYYRCRIYPTIAQSSTEAEFQSMTDAGKTAIYLRSILEEVSLEQLEPTEIEVDNRGARQLANAQQPTRRTRHIDMKDFVILQWTEEEKIKFVDVKSEYNAADAVSKPTGRTKFHTFKDILMGRRRPDYVRGLTTKTVINKLQQYMGIQMMVYDDDID